MLRKCWPSCDAVWLLRRTKPSSRLCVDVAFRASRCNCGAPSAARARSGKGGSPPATSHASVKPKRNRARPPYLENRLRVADLAENGLRPAAAGHTLQSTPTSTLALVETGSTRALACRVPRPRGTQESSRLVTVQ